MQGSPPQTADASCYFRSKPQIHLTLYVIKKIFVRVKIRTHSIGDKLYTLFSSHSNRLSIPSHKFSRPRGYANTVMAKSFLVNMSFALLRHGMPDHIIIIFFGFN